MSTDDAALPALDRREEYLAAAPPPGPSPHPGMVWVPGGSFQMGSDHHYPEEAPAQVVQVDGFREFAFMMGVGVLLETFVVRPLLIPALVSLFGDAGAWPGSFSAAPALDDAQGFR